MKFGQDSAILLVIARQHGYRRTRTRQADGYPTAYAAVATGNDGNTAAEVKLCGGFSHGHSSMDKSPI